MYIDDHILANCLSSRKKGLKGNSNPDLCDGGAVLYQLRNLAIKLGVGHYSMWFDYKPIDVEIDDEFFRPFLLLLKQHYKMQ